MDLREINIRFDISWYYFILRQLHKEIAKKKPPIIEIIDQSTGYTKKQLRDVIRCVKNIIKLKIKIKEDVTLDNKALSELEELREKWNTSKRT